MPLETIIFQETHEIITPFGTIWRKIGGTYKMEEGEIKENILEELKTFVSESHKKQAQLQSQVSPKGDLYFNETTRKYEK